MSTADLLRPTAFPIGLDGGYGAGSGGSQDWVRGQNLTGGIHQSSASDWSQLPLQDLAENQELGWEDNIGLDVTGNGLYWFWDTVWNEPRSHT